MKRTAKARGAGSESVEPTLQRGMVKPQPGLMQFQDLRPLHIQYCDDGTEYAWCEQLDGTIKFFPRRLSA